MTSLQAPRTTKTILNLGVLSQIRIVLLSHQVRAHVTPTNGAPNASSARTQGASDASLVLGSALVLVSEHRNSTGDKAAARVRCALRLGSSPSPLSCA